MDHRKTPSPALLLALAVAASGCIDPDQFLPPGQAGGPAGVLDGTVTYAGPLPCTESVSCDESNPCNGTCTSDGRCEHVVGAAVMLVFDTSLLPPPQGLGTSAASIAVVAGDDLFAGVRDQLSFNSDGSRWCPAPGSLTTVSGDWAASPLPGGTYEIRGFYDLKGSFDPVFSIDKLPVKGDIGGGAVDNATAVLQGAAPIYREVSLGALQSDGSRKIPDTGAHIGGIAVTLGVPLPLDLPTFYVKDVSYSPSICKGGNVVTAPPGNTDPTKATMPSDYTLPVFTATNPAMTEQSIIRVGLAAGLPASEKVLGSKPPFSLPVNGAVAPSFQFNWFDANGDGMLSLDGDHTPDSPLVPTLLPLAIFSKLDAKQGDLVAQSAPVVIIQGLTIYKDLLSTVLTQPGLNDTLPEVKVGVRPAVLCIDPANRTKHAKLLVTHPADCSGTNMVLTDAPGTALALGKQFGRTVDVVYGCLPQGRYAMNLVYDTGQAWTVPNEVGVCAALEPESKDGTKCVATSTPGSPSRPRLPSQDVVVTVGPPDDPSYCVSHPTPAECLP